MASILTWSLVFNLIRTSYATNCNGIMRGFTFHCRYKHVNTVLNLECENAIQNADSQYNNYILLELSREVSREPIVNFENFFETNFLPNSSIYSCDAIVRHYRDPFVLTNHCKNYTSCMYEAFNFLKATDVKAVELNDISDQSLATQNLGHLFPSLEELRIHQVPSYNLSKISIGILTNLKSMLFTESNVRVLPEDFLKESFSLEKLDLATNNINQIDEHTFGFLPSLKTLNLSVNLIHSISKTAFSNAPNLKQLYLMNNQMTTLDEELFLVLNQLEILDLSKNDIGKFPEKIFGNLRKLKNFRCTECRLDSIPEHLFANSTELSELNLSRNKIKYLSPPEVFQKQNSLKIVDLSYNKLFEIPAFNTTGLRVLYLARNEIRSIGPNLTVNSPNLLVLDLSFNHVEQLVDKHVTSFYDLEALYLRSNRISEVELGEKTEVGIRKLLLSNNSIRAFRVAWRKLKILELMEVDNNEITYLDLPPCIDSVKQTVTFSFKSNKITRVGLESLLEDERKAEAGDRSMAGCYFNGMSKNFIDLSFNAFHCDCALYPFYEYLNKRSTRKLDTILNKESLKCSTPEVLRSAPVESLPNDAFTCPAVEERCPHPCRCGLRGSDGRIFINCSGSGLKSAPRHPPWEATVLYLDDNSLRDLGSLNDPAWSNLTELHADRNLLASLDDIPDSLEYLSVRGNQLTTLSERVMSRVGNTSAFRLYLGDNDQRCDCDRKPLKEFLLLHGDLVPDRDEVTCEVDNRTLLPLHTLPDNVLCSIFPAVAQWDALLASLCGSLALLVGLVLLYYKNRPLVLSFLYARFGCFEGEEEEGGEEVVYDAFVAYSSRDRPIVMRLLEELEPRFRLCVHERDWLPGHFITDNIAHSVRGSRRTIAVLSEAFVASPWFRVELRAAAGRRRLIVVLADPDTRLDGVDADLRHLVTKRTYLVWGERWFWQKLSYAMPRRSCQEVVYDDAKSDDVRLIEAAAC